MYWFEQKFVRQNFNIDWNSNSRKGREKTLLITCELHNCMKFHRYIDIDDLTDLVNVEKFKHTKGNK